MNRIYEIGEGRPMWKLRPLQLLVTLAGLVLAAAVGFMLAVSGPVARQSATRSGPVRSRSPSGTSPAGR